ncbi:hypothetical protein HYPSUDRAFT_129730 [Hypholoma sublateritium FD-334 SS-4]|uniref:Uncharacterized protein n=1 Tax=Hypholoma sublateritium (strain FD-334 SS-4) TaxID=945553 RepID=A0A0D2LK47_HYPSF|nr:hypothetical protein HYPSUDRAFT_129730 [Hypholoma sublateritium FD-334 SS-4]
MRPTKACLVRVVPRKLLNVSDSKIYMRPRTQTEEKKEPTLMDTLFAQRGEAGESWPANIRLEPQLKKIVFKGVQPKLRTALKAMTKER